MGFFISEAIHNGHQLSREIHYYDVNEDGGLTLNDNNNNFGNVNIGTSKSKGPLRPLTVSSRALHALCEPELSESTDQTNQLIAYVSLGFGAIVDTKERFAYSDFSLACNSSNFLDDQVYVSGKTFDGKGTISSYVLNDVDGNDEHFLLNFVENVSTTGWSPIDLWTTKETKALLYAGGAGSAGKGTFLASWQLSDSGTITPIDQATVSDTLKFVTSVASNNYIYVLASDDTGKPYIWFYETKDGKLNGHGSQQVLDPGDDYKMAALCINNEYYVYFASEKHGIYSYKVDSQKWTLTQIGQPCVVGVKLFRVANQNFIYAFDGSLASAMKINADGSLSLEKQTTLKGIAEGVAVF